MLKIKSPRLKWLEKNDKCGMGSSTANKFWSLKVPPHLIYDFNEISPPKCNSENKRGVNFPLSFFGLFRFIQAHCLETEFPFKIVFSLESKLSARSKFSNEPFYIQGLSFDLFSQYIFLVDWRKIIRNSFEKISTLRI